VLYQLSYLGPMANQAGCPSAPGGYHAVSTTFNVPPGVSAAFVDAADAAARAREILRFTPGER
jgi:hypothetical protein